MCGTVSPSHLNFPPWWRAAVKGSMQHTTAMLSMLTYHHTQACRECVFSNGGQFFAAVNGTTISIYNTYTCENMGNLRGHNGKVCEHIDACVRACSHNCTCLYCVPPHWPSCEVCHVKGLQLSLSACHMLCHCSVPSGWQPTNYRKIAGSHAVLVARRLPHYLRRHGRCCVRVAAQGVCIYLFVGGGLWYSDPCVCCTVLLMHMRWVSLLFFIPSGLQAREGECARGLPIMFHSLHGRYHEQCFIHAFCCRTSSARRRTC